MGTFGRLLKKRRKKWKNNKIGFHCFVFNPNNNGGEAVSLSTTIFDNGDGEMYFAQSFDLQSYSNQASIGLFRSTNNS